MTFKIAQTVMLLLKYCCSYDLDCTDKNNSFLYFISYAILELKMLFTIYCGGLWSLVL